MDFLHGKACALALLSYLAAGMGPAEAELQSAICNVPGDCSINVCIVSGAQKRGEVKEPSVVGERRDRGYSVSAGLLQLLCPLLHGVCVALCLFASSALKKC